MRIGILKKKKRIFVDIYPLAHRITNHLETIYMHDRRPISSCTSDKPSYIKFNTGYIAR